MDRKETTATIAILSFTFPRAQEYVSERANERANRQTSDLVLISEFLVVLDHSGKTEHCGLEETRIETKVLGHSPVRLLVRSHYPLVRLLRTVRFTCALHCAHLFARSLTSLTPLLVGKRNSNGSK